MPSFHPEHFYSLWIRTLEQEFQIRRKWYTIADVEYEFFEEKNTSPWIMDSLKPIQLSHFDFDGYLAAREKFSLDVDM